MRFLSRISRTQNDMTPVRSTLKEWNRLEECAERVYERSIDSLFKDDPERFEKFHIHHGSILFDYSKNNIIDLTVSCLCDLARACNLAGWRTRMIDGEEINITEGRSVRHIDLRKENPPQEVRDVHERMYEFCENLYARGKIKDVINIGIGGSDLGGRMAYMALRPFKREDVKVHFVSNVDGSHLSEVLKKVKPESTLFIVSSKSFSTQETMANAISAKLWLKNSGIKNISDHFVAISTNIPKVTEFGISEENVFPMWDWVGGRFSIWSAIGLPLCIGIGPEQFKQFLAGANLMDEHFINAPFEKNMPVMLALLGVWNRNFLGYRTLSIAPYDYYLRYFCDYMRQLDMESNGKSVDRDGRRVDYDTGPVVFGEVGTNGQHAFFQLLHQGRQIVPCDFIVSKKPQNPLSGHHEKLVANALAQSQAMMQGKPHDDLHYNFDGNRPSNMIVLDELNPFALGQLMALYEHKIFVQGIIWNINSFDQCGVELGKKLAQQIENNKGDVDGSTKNLLEYMKIF